MPVLALLLALLLSPAGFIHGDAQLLQPKTSVLDRTTPDWAFTVGSENLDVTQLGGCECDVRAGSCDANCCCDQECSELELSTFTACKADGPELPSLEYCLAESSIAKVNLPSSSAWGLVQKKASTSSEIANELLCIAKDRNPYLGAFYTDLGAGTASDLDAALVDTYTFNSEESLQPSTPSTSYMVGDSIPVRYSSAQGSIPSDLGVFILPGPVFSSACSYSNIIGFRRDFPKHMQTSRCQIPIQDLMSECTADGRLSMEPWVKDLQLATSPDATEYVPVTIASIKYLSDGSLANYTLGASKVPAFEDSACKRVIHSVDYRISTNEKGSIISVDANVVLTDMSATESELVFQEFSVLFVEQLYESELQFKSGNPGYWTGFPLLGGILVENGVGGSERAISAFKNGIPIPGSNPSGECAAASSQAVKFGMTSMSTCMIKMNLQELRKFCRGIPALDDPFVSWPPLSSQLLNGTYSGKDRIYVGKWGNANTNNIEQWLEVDITIPENTMEWDDQLQTCTNVPNGLVLDILTSSVGAANNPQKMVSYARMYYTYSDWKQPFTAWTDETNPQGFLLQTVVHFVPIDHESTKWIKPDARPLIPRLSTEVLYPFVSFSSGERAMQNSLQYAVLAMLTAQVLFQL